MIQYFTIINLLFIIFGKRIYKYINILFSSIIVSIIGGTFFWICPKRFYIDYDIDNKDRILVSGVKLKIIDIIFHQLPLLFVIYYYRNYYKNNSFSKSFFNILFILIIYFSIMNIDYLYNTYECKNTDLLFKLSILISFLIYLALII